MQDKKQTNKKVGQCNSLLTHFICRVNMIVSIPGSGTMGIRTGTGTLTWVYGYGYESCMSRVTGTGPRPGPWVQVHKLLYPDKYHEYGYNG